MTNCPDASNPGAQTESPRKRFDEGDTRLFHMQHLCAFISDLAAASEAGAQINEVMAESAQVVFAFLAEEIQRARAELGEFSPAGIA